MKGVPSQVENRPYHAQWMDVGLHKWLLDSYSISVFNALFDWLR